MITDRTMDLLDEYSFFHREVENTPEYQLSLPGQIALPFEQNKDFIRQLHASMGMAGEVGEVLDLFKKQLFGKYKPVDESELINELGDLFWYFWLMMSASGLILDEIVQANILKLSERYGIER